MAADSRPFALTGALLSGQTIRRSQAVDGGLALSFDSLAEPEVYSWRWLRDHSTDSDSLDPQTLQRRVDTFALTQDLHAIEHALSDDGTQLEFRWTDGTRSVLDTATLARLSGHPTQAAQLQSQLKRRLWDSDSPLDEWPELDYEHVMQSPDGLSDWLQTLYACGFSLVHNVPTTEAATEALAARIGPALNTLFGTFWHLSAEQADHGDTAYTTQYLEPHTDGSYYHDAPGLQLFNCQAFDGKGGESVQVDGFAVAERLRQSCPEAFETLCRIEVTGHYLEPGHHVRARRPVIRLDEQGDVEQVTFNNYDRAPLRLSPSDEALFYQAYGLFHAQIIDQRHWMRIPLRPGTALIFDNWRNLHGRMGYTGKRVLYGCYHARATYESRLRTLHLNGRGR